MPNSIEVFIPITMFISVAAVAITSMVLRVQKRKVESAEILAAIEKGVEVNFPKKERNRLLPGLIWFLTGIVMSVALAVMLPEDVPAGVWVWGLTPVAVGAAYLIVYYLESQSEDEEKD